MKFLYIYLIIINAVGFLLMLIDKEKAKRNAWRIPEKTFFTIAVIGGSIGCFVGMYTFRHKTKHKSFTIGIPAIFIIQLFALAAALGKLELP